ncbi:OmpA family protein [Ponticoccus sp. SC2-23]|uniref:OmpA family protein n=1 Tax=Alexandriicola marinus TaxID=2081710 RepID=UPI000FDC79D3|nr:OmpA family protein [Alexandriicola marinus]MBM1221925.1 OmpA family protein [Ponticoccus sp. SC6-9]MBM1226276.1 OmpA family protein [Ponticoccus sp. SC6-15]MBM1230872.1 OmpA family protein [Ponticoccus sp. SC6-38]MBM1235287.1 OmpA family protein [Ponticoccus sp. SC6-45]MBM1239894.1 OmpA family protein [Ponticoccus sp. SC6-49]MBM1244038.1 OmpA family protein [Ponticoccus sp. SC2-64]MBM1248811.1 OmpA family protein [Ponticoccus sp. SC6-42]MBM1253549.1 OmpA family protein [Ponticoccus sp. 
MIATICTALALSLVLLPGPLRGQVLDFPANARPMYDQTTDPDRYLLPTGPWDGTLPTRAVEGAVTRQAWRIDAGGLSVLQTLLPLRQQLLDAGFEVVFECGTEECGGFDFRFATEVLPEPEMHVDLGDFRFLSARRDDEALGVLASVTSREAFVQVIRVAPSGSAPVAQVSGPAMREPTPRSLGDFGARLEVDGRVILSDLSFDTGSAQLGEGSFASLRALAAYLDANQGRRVALVGHTDAEGSLDGNITLSRRRAGSVLERLVSEYGVRRAQLDAQGMGYLSPIATNLTPEGREANRRVEVIIVSTE